MRNKVVVDVGGKQTVCGVVDNDEWEVAARLMETPVRSYSFPVAALDKAVAMGARWVKVISFSKDTPPVENPPLYVSTINVQMNGIMYFGYDSTDYIYYPATWFFRERLDSFTEKWVS